MKRITGLALAIMIFIGCISVSAPYVAAADMSMSQKCIALLKEEEGFSKYPYWDYGQYTVGYGTCCPSNKLSTYKKYGITKSQAETLLKNYITEMEDTLNSYIKKYNLKLSQNQFDAIALFSYNVGSSWTTDTDGLFFSAITYGATGNDLMRAFGLWCKAGGEVQSYLIRRRMSEANMYLNGVYSKEPPENYCFVLYEGNGGKACHSSQVFDSQKPILPACEATLAGKTFMGWYTQPVGGEKVTMLDKSLNGQPLFAQWLEGNEFSSYTDTVDVTVELTGDNVNIRRGPGTGYSVVDNVRKGTLLFITETVENGSLLWGKCEKGWIALKYTDFEEVYAKLPPDAFVPPVPPEEDPTEATTDVTTESTTEETTEETTEATTEETTEATTETTEATEPDPTEPETTEPDPTEPEPTTVTGTVKVSISLRIRSGAGTNYTAVGSYKNGTRVVILEQKTVGESVWGRTDKGWISLNYVVLDKPEPPTEPTEPEPTEPKPTEPEPTEPEPTMVTGTVKANTALRIRSGAGTNYTAVGSYKNGTRVVILEQKTVGESVWGRTDKGWISLNYVVLDKAEEDNYFEVTITGTTRLNVRSAPGASNALVGYLYKNEKVKIYETAMVGKSKWGRCDKGWISLNYTK